MLPCHSRVCARDPHLESNSKTPTTIAAEAGNRLVSSIPVFPEIAKVLSRHAMDAHLLRVVARPVEPSDLASLLLRALVRPILRLQPKKPTEQSVAMTLRPQTRNDWNSAGSWNIQPSQPLLDIPPIATTAAQPPRAAGARVHAGSCLLHNLRPVYLMCNTMVCR